MYTPGIEVATFFQQIFEPPTEVPVRKTAEAETARHLQEATAEANRSSSSGVHGTTRG